MNLKNYKIFVSQHAIDRLKQRFYFKFANYFSHREVTRSLIIGQVSHGYVLTDWKNSPFYVNKIASTYGPNVEVIRMSGVFFICRITHDDRTISVMTCVKKFHGHDGS